MTVRRHIFLLAVAIMVGSTSARAQIVAPGMNPHALDIGYAMRWFHRDVTAPPLDDAQWDVASFYVRLGVFEWLTVTAEAGTWNIEHDDFPGQLFERYVIGGGLAGDIFHSNAWTLSVTASYSEVWDNDETFYSFDKRVYRTIVAAPVSRQMLRGTVGIDLWVAPLFIDDVIENTYFGTEVFRDEPDQHWGVLAGTELVFWRHATLLLSAQYVDYAEGLAGVAFRIGGED